MSRMPFLALLLAPLGALGACDCSGGEAPEPPATAAEATPVEATAEPALQCPDEPPTGLAEFERRRAMFGRAVGALASPVGLVCPGGCEAPGEVVDGGCSGFLVSRDLFVTSGSCLAGDGAVDPGSLRERAMAAKVLFGHRRGPEGEPIDDAARRAHEVVALVEATRNERVDYALLRLAGNPGDRWGIVPTDRVAMGSSGWVVHHAGGGGLMASRAAMATGPEASRRLAAPSDAASRGGLVLLQDPTLPIGMVREPAGCETGEVGSFTPFEMLLGASPTLQRLVTFRAAGNRTTYATLELYCGEAICQRSPARCGKGRRAGPCCDRDADGTADEPPLCWESLELGCVVECPEGAEVRWACSAGASENRLVERVGFSASEVVRGDCGIGCDGTLAEAPDRALVCKFGEYDDR